MPSLNEITENREKKKFKKKSYRPWNLSGDDTNSQNEEPSNTKDPSVLKNISEEAPDTLKQKAPTDPPPPSDNNQVTISERTGNVQDTKRLQKENPQITHREHIDNIPDNVLDNTIDNNILICDKDSIISMIKSLTGIQQRLFFLIVDVCCTKDQLETGFLRTAEIAQVVGCSFGSVKTSLVRLEKKKLIRRLKGKVSAGGFINFSITTDIRESAVLVKNMLTQPSPLNSLITSNPLTHRFSDNTIGNIIDNSGIYSSSSSNLTTTTKNTLPKEWENICTDGIPHFGKKELLNIYRKTTCTLAEVSMSINNYAWGLINNPKRYENIRNHAGMLVDRLQSGSVWLEENYISPEEQAKINAKEKLREKLNRLFEPSFNDWFSKLSDSEREELVPENIKNKPNYKIAIDLIREEQAKLYFTKVIWPKEQEEIESLIST